MAAGIQNTYCLGYGIFKGKYHFVSQGNKRKLPFLWSKCWNSSMAKKNCILIIIMRVNCAWLIQICTLSVIPSSTISSMVAFTVKGFHIPSRSRLQCTVRTHELSVPPPDVLLYPSFCVFSAIQCGSPLIFSAPYLCWHFVSFFRFSTNIS